MEPCYLINSVSEKGLQPEKDLFFQKSDLFLKLKLVKLRVLGVNKISKCSLKKRPKYSRM
jgi:hypothetical protein